jgi:hypothetical protein
MTRFAAPIAEQIWDMKYRLKEADGTALDGSVEDTWRRIARALASGRKGRRDCGKIASIRAGGFQIPARWPDHRGRGHGRA